MTFALQKYINEVFSIIVADWTETWKILICDVSTKSTCMSKYEIAKLYKKYDDIRKHANRIGKVPDFFC